MSTNQRQQAAVTSPNSNLQTLEPTALFSTVLDDFRASLPEAGKSSFREYASSHDMLAAVTADCQQYKQSSRLSKCVSKIASFSREFAPFFDVISIFVQVKPDWFGVFWGSVRLIFQLGTHHVELLENITDHLETLSWTLPQYERHLDRARRMKHRIKPDRLVLLMSFVYADIVKFNQRIHQMLARGKREARIRDRLAFLTGSLWKPFETRFSDLLDAMKTHQALFEKELYVEDQEELMHQFKEFEEHFNRLDRLSITEKLKLEQEERRIAALKIRQIREWLGIIDYQRPLERARRMRFGDTGNWLFNQSAFTEWRDASFPRCQAAIVQDRQDVWLDGILLLQAKPGYGKTVLSASIIDHLLSHHPLTPSGHSNQACTVFYHFEKGDPTRVRSADALKSLASQLIHLYRDDAGMLDGLHLLTETRISGQPQASEEDAETIIHFLLDRYSCYVILDGIDECAEQQHLLDRIRHLCSEVDSKILMLSRPDIDLPWHYRMAKDQLNVVRLSESYNLPDIGTFLEDEFGKAIQLGLFDCTADSQFLHSSLQDDPLDRILPEDIGVYKLPEDTTIYGKLEDTAVYEFPAFDIRAAPPRPQDTEKRGRSSALDQNKSARIHTGQIRSRGTGENFAHLAKDIADIARGHSSETVSLPSICARIAEQSSGMFLWARLLVNYLNSPALSPNDRLEAISGVHHLEGIDELYLSILNKVVKKFEKEKNMVLSIFMWLTYALVPLSANTLHAAIILIPGRPTSLNDRLVDFARSIDRLTCALVEIDERGVPRLIHTSLGEFLQSPNQKLDASGFSLSNSSAAHCHLAVCCLSYIIFDVPRAPLHDLNLTSRYDLDLPCGEDERAMSDTRSKSSAQSLASRRQKLRKEHPLLNYAALCWPEHLTESHARISTSSDRIMFDHLARGWKDALSDFLLDRVTVTVWVEASWTFRWTPTLSRLVLGMQELANRIPPAPENRELFWTLRGLNTLSHALESLKRNAPALGEEPARIWLPQIQEAPDPYFWPNWNFEIQHKSEPPEESQVSGGAGFLPDRQGLNASVPSASLPYVS